MSDNTPDTATDGRKFDFAIIDYEVMDSYNLKAFTLALYVAIVRYAGFKSSKAFPSEQTLADAAGMSTGAVATHLEKLVDAGLITITPMYRENGSNSTNLYTLTPVTKQRNVGGDPQEMRNHNKSKDKSLSEITGGVAPVDAPPHPTTLPDKTVVTLQCTNCPGTSAFKDGDSYTCTGCNQPNEVAGQDTPPPPDPKPSKKKSKREAPKALPPDKLAIADPMAQHLYSAPFGDLLNGQRWGVNNRAHELYAEGVRGQDIVDTCAFIKAQDWPPIHSIDTFCNHISSARAWKRGQKTRQPSGKIVI